MWGGTTRNAGAANDGVKSSALLETCTVVKPSCAAGEAHVTSEDEPKTARDIWAPPKRHDSAGVSTKPRPATATRVPPRGTPAVGRTDAISISSTNQNGSSAARCSPSASTTANGAAPACAGGVTHSGTPAVELRAGTLTPANKHATTRPTSGGSTATAVPPFKPPIAGLKRGAADCA